MSGNSINFDHKKIKKGDFYNKNKKIFNINDIKIKNFLKIPIKHGKKIEKSMDIDFNTEPNYGDDVNK